MLYQKYGETEKSWSHYMNLFELDSNSWHLLRRMGDLAGKLILEEQNSTEDPNAQLKILSQDASPQQHLSWVFDRMADISSGFLKAEILSQKVYLFEQYPDLEPNEQ